MIPGRGSYNFRATERRTELSAVILPLILVQLIALCCCGYTRVGSACARRRILAIFISIVHGNIGTRKLFVNDYPLNRKYTLNRLPFMAGS
jgi:hypothetical protein